jgi:hypothetical protein
MLDRANTHAHVHLSHRFVEELQNAQDGAAAIRAVLLHPERAGSLRSEP